jgi:hypothetical protein
LKNLHQIFGHLCVWRFPLNSKLLGNTDCLHWIWAFKKKWLIFLLPFHSCATRFFLNLLLLLITVCYYHMLSLCPQNINEISLSQKKLPVKYVVKNTRDSLLECNTFCVWQTLFQFAGEIHFLYQILTCINSLKITYIPMI